MLFNSHIFVLLFLPITLIGFFLAARLGTNVGRYWLLAASLIFYGWWSVPFLGLLIVWMISNYLIGHQIAKVHARHGPNGSRIWAIGGISANLLALGYYKYATFFAGTLAALTGIEFALGAVILPLAISFHTFQQIAYLADLQRGQNPKYCLSDYMLFVSFFPQLIAGPIVHHYELLPQLKSNKTFRFQDDRFAEGVAFFVIGLVKKLALADPLSGLAAPMFATAGAAPPGMAEAWFAAIAFALGLYFDFSAYSDMAIGLARMFGVRLPYNFNSPYKSTSIIEFWRRWHITLSRFLRDYLYIPLGGNRKGPTRRSVNLFVTMLLGGLWHGASWTFVIWGGLHGLYLLINHGWNGFCARRSERGTPVSLGPVFSQVLTLLAVVFAWTFFAAPGFNSAISVIGGMIGLNGPMRSDTIDLVAQTIFIAGPGHALQNSGISGVISQLGNFTAFVTAVAVVLLLPNSQEIVDRKRSDTDSTPVVGRIRFHPGVANGLVAASLFLFSLMLMSDVREFVYFQF